MGERLARARARIGDAWVAWPARERTQIVVVLFCVALYLAHYLVFCLPQPFYIEDSGISFAYARNLVDGEGLVPYAGGERVEGFSNALWTFLIAGWYAIGVSVWSSAKIMGALFGSITLFLSWGLARRARPDAEDPLAVAAPFLLACSTQFVLWNSSGLENSLFNLLLAAGMLALAREIQDDRRTPWSALFFALLTMTRPDGMAYAGLGFLARLMGTAARRQFAALGFWIVAFAAVWGPYNAWRYHYFAWWWPNTFYAKERVYKPFSWTGGGWKQVKEYFTSYGIVYAAPLLVVAMTGLRSRARWLGFLLLPILAVFLLWDGRSGVPLSMAGNVTRVLNRNWSDARIWFLLGGSVLLGLLTLGRRGWEVRGMAWGALCAGVFFCVWAQGDWMKGLRWFSQTSVPLFTLLGVGIGALAARLPFAELKLGGRVPLRTAYALPMLIALGVPNVYGSWKFANDPETSPRDVHKRVNYMTWVQKRLGLEHITLLDVDMGAHLWYSGWDIVDIAGLIDVPIAHHRKWQQAFTTDYIFNERRPDFAHVHGSWANTSKINKNPAWETDYVEIPGYPSGRRSLHVGNHVRKDHLVGTHYTGPAGRDAAFAGGITLEGWDVPSPEIVAGGKLYVSTTWHAAGTPRAGFRVVAFLADDAGHLSAAEVAPGYDWYKPTSWDVEDHVYGKWSIAVPESLPKGTYDLGLVLLDEKTGEVLPYQPAAPGVAAGSPVGAGAATTDATGAPAPDAEPRYMRGEWRAAGVVKIVGADAALAAADADYEDALARAKAGDCDGAQEAFRNAHRHVARNDRWYLDHADNVDSATVACLVANAGMSTDPYGQAVLLAQARIIDHRDAVLVAAAVPLAAKLVAEGDSARTAGDWNASYRAYAAALSVDPTLSAVRRAAEEVRDLRLGIDNDTPDKPMKASPGKPPTKPRGDHKPVLPGRAGIGPKGPDLPSRAAEDAPEEKAGAGEGDDAPNDEAGEPAEPRGD